MFSHYTELTVILQTQNNTFFFYKAAWPVITCK